MNVLNLTVTELQNETPNIRALVLASTDGSLLPSWTAGAHVDLHLQSGDTRSYSLINTSPNPSATQNPTSYRFGVRLEEKSRGGSLFVHGLRVGDVVTVSPPKNHFPIVSLDGETVLLAGGIGITPIVSMAAELSALGKPYRLIYAGRTREQLGFLSEIEALCGSRLMVHCDDREGGLKIAELMTSLGESSSLYICGPTTMIEAAITSASALGWSKGRLQFEVFNAPTPVSGDSSFEVVLARSGKHVTVQQEQTILDALIAAGEAPNFDCKRGDCGMCQVNVLKGVPDHRDFYMSAEERASNKLIQICISRSITPVLVLDI
jgi:ferredoxin-NADP reductase